MRARLLDMGEVSASRSQSLYHAVASTMAPDDNPVAIVLRSVSSLVSIGVDREPAAEVDLEQCLASRIPVLHRHLGGPAEVIGRNRLLFHFLLPRGQAADLVSPSGPEAPWRAFVGGTCRTLGLSGRLGPSGEILIGDENGKENQIGASQLGTLGDSLCLSASLARDQESPQHQSVLLLHRGDQVPGYAPTSLAAELDERPDFATVAEAFLRAAEKCFAVEWVPSMPTPGEMDAIYEWDERLVFDLADADLADFADLEDPAADARSRVDQLVS